MNCRKPCRGLPKGFISFLNASIVVFSSNICHRQFGKWLAFDTFNFVYGQAETITEAYNT